MLKVFENIRYTYKDCRDWSSEQKETCAVFHSAPVQQRKKYFSYKNFR